MKRLLPLLILLLIILILVPLLRDGQGPRKPATGLPWQVELTPDGHTRVFGLTLGRSSFEAAIRQHGPAMELAIIADPEEDDAGALELFYGRFMAGMLSGRLILGTNMDREVLLELRERAADSKVLDSGSRKFILDPEDLPTARSAIIDAITFIPEADLDSEVVIQRFGPPDQRLRLNDQIEHLLYPELGLDVLIDREGKEVLQYVKPAEFERLRAPLEQAVREAAHEDAAGSPD